VLGLVTFLCAIPVGIALDRGAVRRSRLLKVAGALGAVSSAAFALVLLCGHGLSRSADAQPAKPGDGIGIFLALCGALALWGIYTGVQSVAVETTFADSVRTGKRSLLYTYKSSLRTAGNSVGPLVSLPIFAALGGQWRTRDLTIVMLVGQALSLVPCAMLFAFREAETLGEESEAIAGPRKGSGVSSSNRGSSVRGGKAADAEAPTEAEADTAAAAKRAHALRVVPWLVASADVCSMLGSGMTVKYFPIFFKDDLGLGPIAVNAIYVICPLLISMAGLIAQRLSLRLGSAQTAFAFRLTGIALLVAISFIRQRNVLIPIYALRTGLMNSTSGLTKGILNDHVPKHRRGFFNALESLNLFSWSGSAVLGGVLVSSIGYRHTFLCTAAVQTMSAMFLVPLFTLVERERRDAAGAVNEKQIVRQMRRERLAARWRALPWGEATESASTPLLPPGNRDDGDESADELETLWDQSWGSIGFSAAPLL
jgi:MFS family permease